MKKTRSKFLKIVDEKHDINFHWPYNNFTVFSTGDSQYYVVKKEHIAFKIRRLLVTRGFFDLAADGVA